MDLVRRPAFRITLAGAIAVVWALGGPLGPAAPAHASSAAGGTQLWLSRFNGLGNGDDDPGGLGASPDGSTVFVTGTGPGSTGFYGWDTVAYDAKTGAKRWITQYNGVGAGSTDGLALSPDGSKVFVTGESFGPSFDSVDYTTVAYDSLTGNQLWLSQYDGPSHQNDFPVAINVSADGNTVFVAGESGGGCCFDYATVAYDAATGTQRWAARYDGQLNKNDIAVALAVSPGGASVFVTGYSDNSHDYWDYATVAYDASTGTQRWARRYKGQDNNGGSPEALTVSPGGGTVYVTGLGVGSTSGTDFATVAYNTSTGATRWIARYNGPGNGDDAAKAISVSPGGSSVFVTGWSTRPGTGTDYATVAYSASTGAQQWVGRYTGPGADTDIALAIAVSPGGRRVFVTGESSGTGTGDDYATVAYSVSTGATLWSMRYDGPAHDSDIANAMVISPGGRKVFVTGLSTGSGTGLDYATIAYSA